MIFVSCEFTASIRTMDLSWRLWKIGECSRCPFVKVVVDENDLCLGL